MSKWMGSTPVLGMDVGEHSIKYVLLSRGRKGPLVEQCGVIDIKENGRALPQAFEELRARLSAKGFKQFRTVAGISGQSVFLRFVRLPPVPKRQMDQIIRYEAQQQVPFPIEEVRWDYQVLSALAQDEREVVLVAVKNEIIEQLSDQLERAGLHPVLVDASILAVTNALSYCQTIHPGTSSLILDIGGKSTHMIIADRGNLWIRNIPIGGHHFSAAIAEELRISLEEAEQIKSRYGFGHDEAGLESLMRQKQQAALQMSTGRLFAEVTRSLGFYRSQNPGAVVQDIGLCGGGALLRGLDQAAKERFQLPAKRVDPFVATELGAGLSKDEWIKNKPFLAGAFGLALRLMESCRLQIDLVPHALKRQRMRVRQVGYASATAVIVFVMGIACWVYASRLAQIQQLRIADLDMTLKNMQELSWGVFREKEQVEILKKKFQRVEQAFGQAHQWPGLLAEIGRVLPSNFWLTRVAGEKDAKIGDWGVVLEGKTSGDIDKDLPMFRQALAQTPGFSDVEILSAQAENGVVEFNIKMRLKALPAQEANA